MSADWSRLTGYARRGAAAAAAGVMLCLSGAVAADPASAASDSLATATPIKHVIVVMGENRSFDNVFGTYVPRAGQSVANLLSKGIVQADGSPGPNFAASAQATAAPQPGYFIGLTPSQKTLYPFLPAPTLNGAPPVASRIYPPFKGLTDAQLGFIEPSLEPGDLYLLTTGATGAGAIRGPDPRIVNGASLPDGPFQLTGPNLPYDSYTGDTAHRFYQMWQQSDCAIANASSDNPSGCLSDLYPFVMTTFAGPTSDQGGGTSMAFYNMQAGDAPLLKQLADAYTMSDNYHQPAMGGTGIQHLFLGTGDDLFWSDSNGNPTAPPAGTIANPNPLPNTNNQYTLDGRFSDCSNPANPGVAPILSFLSALPYQPAPNCDPGHFYALNNVNPPFLPNGQLDNTGIASGVALPPSSVRTIGDALNDNGISWAYYGGGYRAAVSMANGSITPADVIGVTYCKICNFAAYASSIMGDATQRRRHIHDIVELFAGMQRGRLPAVSFVKPDGLVNGHPGASKLDLFEAMVKKILDTLDQNPTLKADTAVFITFDEGGGYYDSGYIQPLDFFGDGPRVPLIVVSPYSRGGRVVHSYTDHVSILKFIERNWGLAPLTARSRDNLPDPVADPGNPYVPTNGPAIGDLFDMFQFGTAGSS